MRPLLILLAGTMAAFTCLSSVSLAQERVHYARVARQIVLRDRTRVPAGGELAIKSDGGEDWIPYMVVSIPSLPKKDATLIDLTEFSPPIDGLVNNITAVYQRAGIPGSIGTHVIPSSNGSVFSKGEMISIAAREGDYYVVASRSRFNALIPVTALDVLPQALATGHVMTVPPVSTGDTGTSGLSTAQIDTSFQNTQMANRPGQLFGQLKVAYTLEGKVLEPGNYVVIAYDDGGSWALGGMVWQNPPRISKNAVDLVKRVNFDTPLTGRINSPTTVYKLLPDVFKMPNTLDQSEIFSNLNPSVRPNDQVYINAREGNDYIVAHESPHFLPSLGWPRFAGAL